MLSILGNNIRARRLTQKDPKEPKRTHFSRGTQKDPKGTQKDIINHQNYIIIRILGKNKFLGIFQLNVLIFFLNTKKEYISKFDSINNVN